MYMVRVVITTERHLTLRERHPAGCRFVLQAPASIGPRRVKARRFRADLVVFRCHMSLRRKPGVFCGAIVSSDPTFIAMQ
jgi:hypothetical protein